MKLFIYLLRGLKAVPSCVKSTDKVFPEPRGAHRDALISVSVIRIPELDSGLRCGRTYKRLMRCVVCLHIPYSLALIAPNHEFI